MKYTPLFFLSLAVAVTSYPLDPPVGFHTPSISHLSLNSLSQLAARGANNAKNAATASAAKATGAANAANATGAANAASGGDPQTSLTLDNGVIAKAFQQTGLEGQADPGEVASLTSPDNFINFCLTTKQPITNGQQVKGGSCNPAPMGSIPSVTKMPSSKFLFPKNMDTIASNVNFTVQMNIQGLTTGHFTNAKTTYYGAPQQLDSSGQIIGHSHVVIQKLTSMTQTAAIDPQVFAFFSALNAPATGGVLSAPVAKGLPAGTYRLASINAAANHQPVLAPVAQHGSLDDMVYVSYYSTHVSMVQQLDDNTFSVYRYRQWQGSRW